MTQFEKFVTDMGGQIPLSKKLKVTNGSISRWLNGDRFPNPKAVNAIRKISKGKIGFQEIFLHHTRIGGKRVR